MELKREDAGHDLLLLVLVLHVHGLVAVDEVLEVAALGDDDVFVPLALLDAGLDFSGGFLCLADDFLFAFLVPDHLLAALGHDATRHLLLVKDAGVGGADLEVRLVAADNEVAEVLAAILDAGVARVAGEPVGEAQLEVADELLLVAVLGDEEVVALGGIFLGRGAGDGAVLDGPMLLAAFPAGEGLAVEQGFEARLIGGEGEQRPRCSCTPGARRHQGALPSLCRSISIVRTWFPPRVVANLRPVIDTANAEVR